MSEGAPGDERAGEKESSASDQVCGSASGDPEHHEEKGEEQQRRTEILLEDHDDQRGSPREQERSEVFGVWHVERANSASSHGQQFAFLDEI